MEDSFLRTTSGLRNEALFHNVDYVVYLEGGKVSFNLNQVLNERKFNSDTLDIAFWSSVFANYLGEKKIKFKSVGSKVVLTELAHMLISNRIDSTLVCIDNEFDELLGKQINDKRVFYPYGYSWENEVFCLPTIKSIIRNFSARQCSPEIETRFNSFISDIVKGVKADYIMFQQDHAFFPRECRLKYVDMNNAAAPIKKDLIDSDIVARGISETQLDKVSIDVQRYCFGHLIADYACALIRLHFSKELNLKLLLCNEILNRFAITLYFNSFPESPVIDQHYKMLFSRLRS